MRQFLLCGAVLAMTAVSAFPANAQGGCQRLWVERNAIYKEAGYCFKTARAISYFGNSGCRYDFEADVPLSRSDRARVAAIQREERALGCR
jgi:hypothetical protein